MQKGILRASVALLMSLSLTGCIAPHPDRAKRLKAKQEAEAAQKAASADQKEQAAVKGTAPTSPANTAESSIPFLFPNPGPFKLVTNKDGEELWQARGDVGEFGGTLNLGAFGDGPKTFNTWDASDVESHGIGMVQNDSLVDIDPWTGKATPKLCKTVDVSDQGRVITFVLRKGLKWSDGHPLTADDVVFTFDTIVRNNWGEGSSRDTMCTPDDFPQIVKVDDLTVKFVYKKPFSPLLLNLNAIIVGPKHVLEPITKKGKNAFRPFWNVNADPKTFVGSGPFIVSKYIPGQRVEFKRNPHYAMVDAKGRRLPYLDKMTISIVREQPQEILKFLGKEIDLLDVRSVRGMDAALLRSKEKENNFTLYSLGPDDGTVYLMLNMCQRNRPKDGKPYVDPIKQKWFNNDKFRWAISHAIDRQSVVNNVLKGIGYPLYTCQTTASVYHNTNLEPIKCDLQMSEQLLKDAGFVKKNNELYDSDGHRVEFGLITNSGNTVRDAVCIHIKEQLKLLGIKVNYQPIEFNTMINRTHTSLDWEAIMMGLSGSRLEPYSGSNVWKSDGRMHEFDQRLPEEGKDITVVNDARPWEKEIDKCLDTAAASFDEKVRTENYQRAEAIAYEYQPFIYIYATSLLTAARNELGNYRPTHLGIYYTPKGTMHNLEEIYLKKGGH